jgi:hypothetical protein
LVHSGTPSRHSASGFIGHATDRLILTQSRIAAPTSEDDPLRDDLVGLRSQLDLGLLIQPRHHALAADLKPALQHWLGHRLATPAPETLRQHIDHALSHCIEPHQGTVQAALLDLRLGLFPQAPLTETTA